MCVCVCVCMAPFRCRMKCWCCHFSGDVDSLSHPLDIQLSRFVWPNMVLPKNGDTNIDCQCPLGLYHSYYNHNQSGMPFVPSFLRSFACLLLITFISFSLSLSFALKIFIYFLALLAISFISHTIVSFCLICCPSPIQFPLDRCSLYTMIAFLLEYPSPLCQC